MNILFFIGTLTTGGAERQMSVLAKGMAGRGHKVAVVTLFPGGPIANDLSETQRIELVSLWSKRSKYLLFRLFQILLSPLILRRLTARVDCLYSMLEVTNFIAWVATRFKKNVNLIWGIRSSDVEDHWKMALFDNICAFISPTIKLLIANSFAGLECLLIRGYRPQRHVVIPNGMDTEKFRYNKDARRKMRRELDVFRDQPLIGIVARLNPMKDHPTFLKAAAHLVNKVDDVRFLCIGGGPDSYAEELRVLADKLGLKDRVIWLGDQSNMVAIYSALDIVVSSSAYGEGFSNAIGEAMSCGVPCVVTDVGDSARIVGDRVRVVEPRSPEKLAQAIYNTLQRKAEVNWAKITRSRIEEEFSLKRLIDLTEQNLSGNYAVD